MVQTNNTLWNATLLWCYYLCYPRDPRDYDVRGFCPGKVSLRKIGPEGQTMNYPHDPYARPRNQGTTLPCLRQGYQGCTLEPPCGSTPTGGFCGWGPTAGADSWEMKHHLSCGEDIWASVPSWEILAKHNLTWCLDGGETTLSPNDPCLAP